MKGSVEIGAGRVAWSRVIDLPSTAGLRCVFRPLRGYYGNKKGTLPLNGVTALRMLGDDCIVGKVDYVQWRLRETRITRTGSVKVSAPTHTHTQNAHPHTNTHTTHTWIYDL